MGVPLQLENEQLAAFVVEPVIPMAHKQLVIGETGYLRIFHRLIACGGTGQIVTIEVNRHRNDELAAIWAQFKTADVERQIGDLSGVAAAQVDSPDLRAVIAAGKKVDARAVGCPGRIGVVGFMRGQLAGVTGFDVCESQIVTPLVGIHVRFTDRISDGRAVGRKLRCADTIQADQVLRGKRLGGSIVDSH